MEQQISLKQIIILMQDVFDINQTKIAAMLDETTTSHLSNAISGARYIHKQRLTKIFYDDIVRVYEDGNDDNRPYAIKQMKNHLKQEGLLYHDIELAANRGYKDFVVAILNHYPPKPKPLKEYEDIKQKGDDYYSNSNFLKALELYGQAEDKVSDDEQQKMELFEKMAYAYAKTGDYDRSANYYVMVLRLCRALYGKESFEAAHIYECLGFVYEKKRSPKAIKSFEIAKNIRKRRLDINPNDYEVARLYNYI